MSDLPFKSMDEVKSFAAEMKSQLDAEGYKALLFLLGLLDNQGVSKVVEIHGEPVQIDFFIAPMLAELQSRGFQTLSCCSGLKEEHKDAEYKPESGYISFLYEDKLYDFLQNQCGDKFEIKKSEAYLQPSIYVGITGKSDSVLKDKWSELMKILFEYK